MTVGVDKRIFLRIAKKNCVFKYHMIEAQASQQEPNPAINQAKREVSINLYYTLQRLNYLTIRILFMH